MADGDDFVVLCPIYARYRLRMISHFLKRFPGVDVVEGCYAKNAKSVINFGCDCAVVASGRKS